MREELLKGLSEEQKKKLMECKSAEEVLALAKAEGVELNDEQLEAISGGCSIVPSCKKCGSTNIEFLGPYAVHCKSCGAKISIFDIFE